MAAVKNTISLILSKPRLRDSIKITVINYESTARLIFKKEVPSLDLLNKIDFKSGGTNFELPLTMAYDTILETKNEFDMFTIGFLTDGIAPYPTKIIDKINADKEKIKSKITFNCILFGKESSNLETISKNLKGNYTKVINFEELKNSFKEIINIGFK